MCYPCTGCNGCGKMNSGLFDYLIAKPLCLHCGTEYTLGATTCSQCGKDLPALPGEQGLHSADE